MEMEESLAEEKRQRRLAAARADDFARALEVIALARPCARNHALALALSHRPTETVALSVTHPTSQQANARTVNTLLPPGVAGPTHRHTGAGAGAGADEKHSVA